MKPHFHIGVIMCLLVSSTRLAAVDAGASGYTLIGWNDLGMHCEDGLDYSVFSILPPYNTIHAQLVYQGWLVTNATSVTVTYEAIPVPKPNVCAG